MSNSYLFFGLPISENEEKILKSIDPILIQLYIQEENSDYLRIFVDKEQKYLGKVLENGVYLSQLDLIQGHIQSILNQLSSDFSHSLLILFPFSIHQ